MTACIGWEKAMGDAEELAWWEARVRLQVRGMSPRTIRCRRVEEFRGQVLKSATVRADISGTSGDIRGG